MAFGSPSPPAPTNPTAASIPVRNPVRNPDDMDGEEEDEEVEIVFSLPQSRKLQSSYRSVPNKIEKALEGAYHCPHEDCKKKNGTVYTSEKGCNVTTCRDHSRYFYFCCHCKVPCPGGEPNCACPKRNTIEARIRAQNMRNEASKNNPIDIDA
jgi:hypothetical protein